MRKIATFSAISYFLFGAPAAHALTSTPPANTWSVNGSVSGMAKINNTIYLGGNFDQVGPYTGGGVPIDRTTGNALTSFPRVEGGAINCAISDQNGGWFIAGDFKTINGNTHAPIAHIHSSGQLDSNWNVTVQATQNTNNINTLLLLGNRLYIGGSFSGINNQNRKSLAAVDAATGNLLTWNPSTDGTVFALLPFGSDLFVAGSFQMAGGQSRSNIARFDEASGVLRNWAPATPIAAGTIYALAASSQTLYIGGNFTLPEVINPSHWLVAVDLLSNAVTPREHPFYMQGTVYALALAQNTLHVGSEVNDAGNRNGYLMSYNIANNLWGEVGWRPAPDGRVRTLLVLNSTLYMGGNFQNVLESASSPTMARRQRLAAFSLTPSGALDSLLPWQAKAAGNVMTLGADNSHFYVGGTFSIFGGEARRNLAALDATTGIATSWDPNPNAPVNSLATDNATVYVGGDFTQIDGSSIKRIAAIDAASGHLRSGWTLSYTATIETLLLEGTTLYCAGGSGAVSLNPSDLTGVQRSYIFAINTQDLTLQPWNPSPNGAVTAIVVHGENVILGGNFSSVGGVARVDLAAVDRQTGIATNWNPQPNHVITAMTRIYDTLYLAGAFTSINGQPRNGLAAWNLTTNTLSDWAPPASPLNSSPYSLAANGLNIVMAGPFDRVGTQSRSGVAELEAVGGSASAWNPQLTSPSNNSNTIVQIGSELFVGGAFIYRQGSQAVKGFLRFNTDPIGVLNLTSMNPLSASTATAVQVTLNGSNFANGCRVRIGGTEATNVVTVSNSRITATLPVMPVGAYDVTVINPDNQQSTLVAGFTFLAEDQLVPVINSVSPNLGSSDGGTQITILGSNFVRGARVLIGATPATNVIFIDGTQLKATTPGGGAGAYDVRVFNPNGKSATLQQVFGYISGLVVTAVTPNRGPLSGGTRVTIEGFDFMNGDVILFGTKPALSVSVVSPTKIIAISPSGANGPCDVYVNRANGSSQASITGAFTYDDTLASAPPTTETLIYPNPYRGKTNTGPLNFQVPQGAHVRVFDRGGQLVAEMTDNGAGLIPWTLPGDLASGIYVVLVESTDGTKTTKQVGVIR